MHGSGTSLSVSRGPVACWTIQDDATALAQKSGLAARRVYRSCVYYFHCYANRWNLSARNYDIDTAAKKPHHELTSSEYRRLIARTNVRRVAHH